MEEDRPVALITGTSRGIGRALAAHFAGLGYAVHGCSRAAGGPEGLDHYTHHVADVGDEAAVRALVRAVGPRLDVLVNNAGIGLSALALSSSAAAIEATWRTNFLGTVLCAREAAKPMMRRRYGRIVSLSSMAVPLRMEGSSVYGASKAAVEHFTRVLARELAPTGITANVVAPSFVETDMVAGFSPEVREACLAALTIRRPATVAEVCHAVEFFTRPEAAVITGQTLVLGLAA